MVVMLGCGFGIEDVVVLFYYVEVELEDVLFV